MCLGDCTKQLQLTETVGGSEERQISEMKKKSDEGDEAYLQLPLKLFNELEE